MALSVPSLNQESLLNLIMGYSGEIPPRYQKVREAVAHFMGIWPDLIIYKKDGMPIVFKVIYLSPTVTKFEEIAYYLMSELHDHEGFRSANSSLIEARVEPQQRSVFLGEGCISEIHENVDQAVKVQLVTEYFMRYRSIDPDLVDRFIFSGWDSPNTSLYESIDIKMKLEKLRKMQTDNPKLRASLDEKVKTLEQRLSFILEPEYQRRETAETFPERTRSMIDSLGLQESVQRDEKFTWLVFLVAGFRHLIADSRVTHPDFNLSAFYEALLTLRAVILCPAECEHELLEIPPEEINSLPASVR